MLIMARVFVRTGVRKLIQERSREGERKLPNNNNKTKSLKFIFKYVKFWRNEEDDTRPNLNGKIKKR